MGRATELYKHTNVTYLAFSIKKKAPGVEVSFAINHRLDVGV